MIQPKIIINILVIFFVLSFIQKDKLLLVRKNEYLIKEYKNYSENFLNLRESNYDDSLISEENKNILKFLNKITRKNISSVKKIIFSAKVRFGNIMIALNRLIFFCEIIKCNEIILKNDEFCFIKNSVFLKDFNITISKLDGKQQKFKYLNDSEVILLNSFNVFYYFYKIKPKIRINLLRYEIIKNLPKVNVSNKDLFIHMRSGDIFGKKVHKSYAQPPLCFYISIIKNFQFNKIYLISQDKNYIIDRLLNKFNNIIYSPKELKNDISYLINAYNIVGSISSFLNVLLMLNTNLENYFEYNMIKIKQKITFHHYNLFEYPKRFTIYKMDASSKYKNKMYYWYNNRIQQKIMMKEKCINSFMIIRNSL